MSWNGSNEVDVSPSKSISAGSHVRGRALKCLSVSLLIGISGVVVWWLLKGTKSVTVSDSVRDNQVGERTIAEVRPSIATHEKPLKEQCRPATRVQAKTLPPQRAGEVRDGYIMFADGSKARCDGVITSRVDDVDLAYKTFKSFPNRLIASLLTMAPGNGLLGSSEQLYANFDEEFDLSKDEEILITKDDTDEQRLLKEEVIALRKELSERKAQGENLEKLMVDTRNKFMELAAYRSELEEQVSRLKSDNDLSEEDEEELIMAANKMLEDRGIKPFELPSAATYYIENQFTPAK